MPTPHGSRGGMAFSADELRVLRRVLAQALHPMSSPAPKPAAAAAVDQVRAPGPRLHESAPGPGSRDEDAREYARLAEALEEAVREGRRLREFLLADLVRYRDALPGTAADYMDRLSEALGCGYLPVPDDLTALHRLRGLPCSPAEHERRCALLRRCHELAERELRTHLGKPREPFAVRPKRIPGAPPGLAERAGLPVGIVGASRGSRALDVLFAVRPGASKESESDGPAREGEPEPEPKSQPEPQPEAEPEPKPKPEAKPKPRPEPEPKPKPKPQPEPQPKPGREREGKPEREPAPKPGQVPTPPEPERPERRRTPTPAEIWPPRHRNRPSPPDKRPDQRRALLPDQLVVG